MTQFTDFGLDASILRALAAKGYVDPTPIQAAAIPGVMSGRDLLGIAQTGTGKTAAFALPILHRLAASRKPAPRKGCRALILSPTRELATQIAEQFRAYGAELGLSVETCFGGVGHSPQIKALARGVDVLVAAPGRLLDHLGEKDCDLSQLEIFVLDEADQMLDMGFIVPIRKIIRHLPRRRQNLFFSATMPKDIGELAAELLSDPLHVSVTPPATTVERINQQVVFLDAKAKRGLLVELFARPDFSRVLVFTRTKRGADKVARVLEAAGVAASAIHGNKSQGQREKALAAFKAGEVRALVATDIAARGIDISSVSHVVQFELPDVPDQYVHRIGRTARAGKDGSAIAFCADDERALLKDIERVTRQKIPSADRRGDAALLALAAASPEPRAEPRGPAQPRRNAHNPRPEQRAPRAAPAEAAEGSRKRRRRRGGKGGGAGSPGWSGVEAKHASHGKPQEQSRPGVQSKSGAQPKPQNQAKSQKPSGKPRRPQRGAPRNDVLAANLRDHKGPPPPAGELMRFLSEGRRD